MAYNSFGFEMVKIKDMTDQEIVELIQELCKHRNRTVFSDEGHNFLQCTDCGKCFYEEDI